MNLDGVKGKVPNFRLTGHLAGRRVKLAWEFGTASSTPTNSDESGNYALGDHPNPAM